MKLVQNWRIVLKKAWSVKFNITASLLAGAEVAVTVWQPAGIAPGLFAALAAMVSIGSNVMRILAQSEVTHAPE